MALEELKYVPILRWKQGEQFALRKVEDADRQWMLPIAEVQEVEASVAQPKLQKTMLESAGTDYPIGVDFAAAGPRLVPHALLADRCRRLQAAGVDAWPVIRVSHGIADLAGLSHFKDYSQLVLRSRVDQSPLAEVLQVVAALVRECGRTVEIHVVLDMYAIGDVNPVAKAAQLQPQVAALSALARVQTVTVAGGSFPLGLGGLKQGGAHYLERKELKIWQEVRKLPDCDEVIFGDYGVTNPEPLEEIDPSKLNPAAAIRYTLSTTWRVLRGGGVKTPGKGGMGQYKNLCKILIKSPDYSGGDFQLR
ncbi:beta family protein [Xanthomonas euvesicatoria]|uniref:beta family protein n=1 Tax=Xanthomonas euvesicatoria TaxID=456327 RepID=UPI001C471A20|nr:beta family protein [Xanthomonas euvesicatoria]MBV6799647.1 beta family protein [Xanthomonas campestris pv. obscurae]